ncbi:LysR substrate-binding domain-containing protein [Pseudothauera rhizosphaerae]|uniref:LysR family transcriptional regulator n=1 Tax=Pseudothauera rhizosphaerae TaxID=2565932 RepID=A0A4S4AAJ6_9RHOO|nr:LysR substrate-binding domain-containing protein [Pseudothauera rhizosphaerae]THF55171.1 LysR family transcriptional regulator [Pseudothauera rhizosphaerae]
MDLRHLRYFIAVAEEQNIGRAAARLHISQPPLTRQIQQLEEELGARLFLRTPRGVELTEAGELFLEEARNIRALVEQATERTQRAGQGRLGRLDVAIFGSAILDRIPKLLLAFRSRYPDVNVVLHTMTKVEQIEALRQRRISVGFNRMVAPGEDIAVDQVSTEDLLLAVPADHPLARHERIRFPDLKHHPMVLFPTGTRPSFIDKVVGLCNASGFQPQVSQEVGDAVTGVALVAGGFGVCLVPESATTLQLPGVIYRRLTDTPPGCFVDLCCIYRKGDKSPIVAAFRETVQACRSMHAAQAEASRQIGN